MTSSASPPDVNLAPLAGARADDRAPAADGQTGARRQRTGIVACGALAIHLERAIAKLGLDAHIYPLPPLLHSRPERISDAVERRLGEIAPLHERLAVAYADCGTYGALDRMLAERYPGVERMAGWDCYQIFAGPDIERLSAEEPGTYFLTDFLVRAFDRVVVTELGLDRYPELRDDYFRHYRRMVWLRQDPHSDLLPAARHAAETIGLALEVVDVGEAGLVRELARIA